MDLREKMENRVKLVNKVYEVKQVSRDCAVKQVSRV